MDDSVPVRCCCRVPPPLVIVLGSTEFPACPIAGSKLATKPRNCQWTIHLYPSGNLSTDRRPLRRRQSFGGKCCPGPGGRRCHRRRAAPHLLCRYRARPVPDVSLLSRSLGRLFQKPVSAL